MVSLNWSVPLRSLFRQSPPVSMFPLPQLDNFSQGYTHCDRSKCLALQRFLVESPNLIFVDVHGMLDVFLPVTNSGSSLVISCCQKIETEQEFGVFVVHEPILEKHLELFTSNIILDFTEFVLNENLEETTISVHLEDLLPVSCHSQPTELNFAVDIEDCDQIVSVHCLPVFMDHLVGNRSISPSLNLSKFSIDGICYNSSSIPMLSLFHIEATPENISSHSGCRIPLESDQSSQTCLAKIDDVVFLPISTRQSDPLEKLLSTKSVKNIDVKESCCHSLVLDAETRQRMLKHLIARLQTASPELLEVPELPFQLPEDCDPFHFHVDPFWINSESKSITSICTTMAWCEPNAVEEIIHEMKSCLPYRGSSYIPRPDTITEENEDEISNPLAISPVEFCTRVSPSSAPCSSSLVSSYVSHLQTHGSLSTISPSKKPSRFKSRAISQCAASKQHSLEDFIALNSASKPNNKEVFPVNFKDIEIAPSETLLDAIDLFLHAAAHCTKRLQTQGYLQPSENLLVVSPESVKNIFKRATSRLRLNNRSDHKDFPEIQKDLQNALAFALLRQLFEVLIHCGITLCYKYLCHEIRRQDLGFILFSTSNGGRLNDCFDELYLKLNLLFVDVCHKHIRDHPKIDALVEQLQPRTVVICNRKSLVAILCIALSSEECLDLGLLVYAKGETERHMDADVLLAFYEDLYSDENFPWASFKKIIFYEGYVRSPGEYLIELIETGKICCLVLRMDEKHADTQKFNSINNVDSRDSSPGVSNYSIIVNSRTANQCSDICEKLLSKIDVNLVWRENGTPATSFITSSSSLVVLNALNELDQARLFVTSIRDLCIQYKKVTVIIAHDVDAVSRTDFLQIQMSLIAGLAPSIIGFQCHIVFATMIEEIVETICQDLADQVPISNIASNPSDQERFLVKFPSLNPAAAAFMVQSYPCISRLFSASLAELKARFRNINPISLELFHKLSHIQLEQPLDMTANAASFAARTVSSGGDRRSPEQSSCRKRRRMSASNNHKLEEFWGPSKKSLTSRCLLKETL